MTDAIARTAIPRREIPGEHPEIARLSAMVVALLGELAVTRERLDTVERVAEQSGCFSRASVEAYRAEGPAEAERDGIRRQLIDVVMQPIQRAGERRSTRTDHAEADQILNVE